MTTKRFTIIDEQFISYYGGTGHLISNGECKIWLWHSKEESQKVCDKLNNVLDENEQLKQRIKELELLNNSLNYALQNIRKIDVEIDVRDKE